MEALSAVTLKDRLWETLNRIRTNELDAAKGDAIASQAREILRTTNTQLKIVAMSKLELSDELIGFAMPKKLI